MAQEIQTILGPEDYEAFQRDRERIGLFASNSNSVTTSGLNGSGQASAVTADTNDQNGGDEAQMNTNTKRIKEQENRSPSGSGSSPGGADGSNA